MATWLILANKGIPPVETAFRMASYRPMTQDAKGTKGASCKACLHVNASLRRRHLEHEGRHAADSLVQQQRPRERRLGALAAIGPLAQPAIDADRNRLRLVEIETGGIDQPRCIFQLAAEPDGIARLRLTMGHDGAVDGLGNREITRTVRQLDNLGDQAVGRLESCVHVPERTGAAELRKRESARREALGD